MTLICQRREFLSHLGSTIAISTAWAMRLQMGRLVCILMIAQRSSLLPINSPPFLVHCFDGALIYLRWCGRHFDYISSRRQGTVYVRKNYTVGDYPEELKSKVYLLKHFEGYIMGKLYGDYEYTFLDSQRTKGMQFVQKYLRMKHVIVFKLSHDVLQVALDLYMLGVAWLTRPAVQFL